MAISEITTYVGSSVVLEMSRGNIGSVIDSVTKGLNALELPDKAIVGGVYPAVGDVESGVIYGPNGSDFTGTVVIPQEADVRLNTQYGAGGTEFTGSLSGGGNVFVICD